MHLSAALTAQRCHLLLHWAARPPTSRRCPAVVGPVSATNVSGHQHHEHGRVNLKHQLAWLRSRCRATNSTQR